MKVTYKISFSTTESLRINDRDCPVSDIPPVNLEMSGDMELVPDELPVYLKSIIDFARATGSIPPVGFTPEESPIS